MARAFDTCEIRSFVAIAVQARIRKVRHRQGPDMLFRDHMPFAKVTGIHFDVAQNFSHQARADVFSFVDRDRRAATVGMFELPMAAVGLSQKLEAHLFQGTNQDARFDVR